MTAPRLLEKVVVAAYCVGAPVAGDYFTSQSGHTVLAVSKVRRVVGGREGPAYRLLGLRLRVADLPAGAVAKPWPCKPPRTAGKSATVATLPLPRVSPAAQRFKALTKVKTLLADDRDTERPVAAVRLLNGSAVSGEWRDPDDLSTQRRAPKVIRGYRSADQIETLQSHGSIGRSQAQAARRFRKSFELGEVGLRPSRDLAQPPGGFEGATGPSESRMQHLQIYRQTIQAIGPRLTMILLSIIVHGETVQRYSEKRRQNRRVVAGYLLAALDALIDHYKDVDRPTQSDREPLRAQTG